ncbi:hypothetical protein EDB85DRAFT_2193475 [Lactarius pseudohatsudake]|nr:hypothetical protein EDB85DRAFT_2193475 [Lactarius pseudohatsudake]
MSPERVEMQMKSESKMAIAGEAWGSSWLSQGRSPTVAAAHPAPSSSSSPHCPAALIIAAQGPVAQRILGNNESVDEVARKLHEKLLLRNESTKKVVIKGIYKDSEESRHNVDIFSRVQPRRSAAALTKDLHGKVYASADAQHAQLVRLWLFAVNPTTCVRLQFQVAAVRRLRVVTAVQSRYGFRDVWRAKDVQRV